MFVRFVRRPNLCLFVVLNDGETNGAGNVVLDEFALAAAVDYERVATAKRVVNHR